MRVRRQPANQAMLPLSQTALEFVDRLGGGRCLGDGLNVAPTRFFPERHRDKPQQSEEHDNAQDGATPKTEQHDSMVTCQAAPGQNDRFCGSGHPHFRLARHQLHTQPRGLLLRNAVVRAGAQQQLREQQFAAAEVNPCLGRKARFMGRWQH